MSEVENAQAGAEVAEVAEEQQAAQATESTPEQVEAQEAERVRDEKGRFVPQERVNEITRARREAERERDYWREQAQHRPQAAPSQQHNGEAPPSIEHYQDVGQWSQAMTEYAVTQAEARVEARFRGQDQQRSTQQLSDRFDERSRAYEAVNPGFNDRLNELTSNVQFSYPVVEAIGMSDHGPAIADYLSRHLDEADSIARLPPHLAALQLGRIEAKVSTIKPKPVSKAPNPAPTLGGGAAASRDPERLSIDDWMAQRRDQITK